MSLPVNRARAPMHTCERKLETEWGREGHRETRREKRGTVQAASSANESWHSHAEGTKRGETGGGGWGSKAPKSEVRQSSFSGIVELRSSSDFTNRKSLFGL